MTVDKGLLTKATAATEEPTPGWMFHQIAKMTRTNFNDCVAVEEFLLKRLKSESNPHSKKKVLKIIQSLAQQGDPQFARNIAKKVEEIKTFASYRGPQDPLHGDALNQAIRMSASQAVDAIFNTLEGARNYEKEKSAFGIGSAGAVGETSFDPSNPGYSAEGIASPSFASSTPAPQPAFGGGISSNIYTNSGLSKFQGIGSNPNAAAPSSYTPPTNVVPLPNNAQQQNQETWGSWVYGKVSSMLPASKAYGQGESLIQSQETQSQYQPQYVPPTAAATLGSLVPSASVTNSSPSAASTWGIADSNGEAAGTHEAKIVDDFTAGVGVKVSPTRQELTQFVTRCAAVKGEYIAKFLDEKLASPMWQVRAKSLFGIEALVKAKNVAVIQYFTTSIENVQKQSASLQETVAKTAQKILKLMNRGDLVDTSAQAPKVSPKQTPGSAKTPATPQSPVVAPAPVPVAQSPLDNLLDLSNDLPPQQTAPAGNMFGGMTVTSVQQPQQPAPASNGGLDDLESWISGGGNTQTRPRGQSNPQAILELMTPTMQTMTMARPIAPTQAPVIIPMTGNSSTVPLMPIYYVPQPVAGIPGVAAVKYQAPVGVRPVQMPQQATSNVSGFEFLNARTTTTESQRDHFDFVNDLKK